MSYVQQEETSFCLTNPIPLQAHPLSAYIRDPILTIQEVDPSLTNPKTSLKELIIPDEERQGGGPVYMLSKSPGKGMGLFATEFIPAGTKILEEKPVLTCPANGRRLSSNDLQEFVGQFFGLSPSLQKAVSNLQGEQVSRWSPQMTFYQELLTTEVMHPSGSRLSSEQRSTLEHLLRIFYTNCAALYPDFAGPRRHIGDGLFLTFSRINHSCEANAVWDTCRRPGIMSIRAAKDIQPDEEITISYFPETNESVQKRREITKGWGFLCQCSKCGPLTH